MCVVYGLCGGCSPTSPPLLTPSSFSAPSLASHTARPPPRPLPRSTSRSIAPPYISVAPPSAASARAPLVVVASRYTSPPSSSPSWPPASPPPPARVAARASSCAPASSPAARRPVPRLALSSTSPLSAVSLPAIGQLSTPGTGPATHRLARTAPSMPTASSPFRRTARTPPRTSR